MKYLLISLFATGALLSCSHPAALPETDPGAITDSIVQSATTAPAVLQNMDISVKLNGKIQADDSKQAKVFALVSGRIESIHAELGDYVQKGQVLAVIKSTEVAAMSNDLSLAESNVTLSKKNMETSKDLFEGKLATEQDFINAKIAYNKALSEQERAKQVAEITGGKSSTYTIKAPLSGYVIEKNITASSEVRADNNTDLFAIADLSSVWIMASVYESDMNNIQLGDTVKINTLAKPDKDYTGKIDKIYNVLDPATRTMKVRVSMSNPGNELKPEMFATIRVNSRAGGKTMAIPSRAIVLDNSKNYVVIKNAGALSVKEINLLKRIDSTAYISGLTEGDLVVTNAQVFLYQALNTK